MKRWGSLIMVLLVAAPLLFGQAQTTARLTGRVADDAGSPVPGASVHIRHTELQLERTATTSATGEFIFSLLPTGPYEVTITAPGRQPEFYRMRLGVGETAPLDVRLAPGDVVSETITVTGSTTALETTAVGQNFDYDDQVEILPIIERDLEDVAALSPNISFGPTPGTLAIAGAPSFDTRILLDGAEMSDPYFGSAPTVYIEDAIEEVQVLTSGVSARYGRFQGGVINAITKSGGNEFEGTFRTELESQSWNAKTPYGEDLSEDVQQTYQGTLGGPIVRDKLWFFGALRTIPETSAIETASYTEEPISESRSEDRWQLKLRGALGGNHLIDVSYLKYDAEISNYVGLISGDDLAVGRRADPRTTQTLSYQGVLTPSTFVEFQGTRKNVEIMSGGDPDAGDPFIELATVTVFNNGWWDFSDPSVRSNQTLSANITHAANTARLGSHTLEAGFQRVASTTGGENRQSPTGLNFLALNTETLFYAGSDNGEPLFNVVTNEALRWSALPLGGDQVITNNALYVQDTVSLNRVRLDLGLRYDMYEGRGPSPEYRFDFSGLAPRLGLTFNVTPVWQLQATYGRYISRLNDNVANSVTGVSGAPRVTHLYTGPTILGATADQVEQLLRDESAWGLVVGYLGVDQPTVFQNADLDAPYADDINFSVRHALPRAAGSVVLSYIHRDYKNLLDDFIGEVCNYGASFELACPAGNTRVIRDPATGAALAEVDTTVWMNDPRAKREYRALALTWDYRPGLRWQLAGNYTLGTTKANYEGEGRNTPASGSIFGDYERSINLAAATPFGYADDDIRHRVNVLGSYTADLGRGGELSLGSILSYQSGLPYSLVATVGLTPVDEYVSEGGTYTHFFGEDGGVDDPARGSQRFSDWWSLDLAARYNLPIFSDFGPFIRLAVLNVLNNQAVVQHQISGRAVRDTMVEGQPIIGWEPIGNCGPGDEPSTSCTGFGRIRNELDYQNPRAFQISVGLQF